ncbi:MAG: GGDEF domain-containing protein [Oscillospiraceae bacterium]|nr:GGDEF domain-containing protein [Oscillospiraceae bacterium]
MSGKTGLNKNRTFEIAGLSTYVIIYAVLLVCQQKLAPVIGASSVILGITMQLQSLLSAFTVISIPGAGYHTALTVNSISVIILIINILVFDRNNAITGLICTISAIIMISIIHFFYKRILINNKELTETNRQLNEKDKKLSYLAYYDILTGLPSRQLFIDKIDNNIKFHPTRPFTVISANIDDFTDINDKYGINAGDAVLCSYSKKLQRFCTNSMFLARLSADEFGIIIESQESEDNINNYIEAIREIIAQPVRYGQFDIYTSMSFGSASYPANAANSTELLKCVNSALYYSKSHGKNRACYYSNI